MSVFSLPPDVQKQVKALKGPILVFGAGGFIGLNLLNSLLEYRKDVYGISQDPNNNWRFLATDTSRENLRPCDIREPAQIDHLLDTLKPQTIFNLAAYGAYSKQNEYKKIYMTNFNSHIDLVEHMKKRGFAAYVYAGSSSEYGLNSAAPKETDELIPNSHYAVSKTAVFYSIKYYGKVEKLPVVHFRLYSAYGPWEEPDRLIPIFLKNIRKSQYPPLVQPEITRDFIYITDISSAFISAAYHMDKKIYGESFNVGTGIKTSIRQLAAMGKKIGKLKESAKFGSMENRDWDMADWFANNNKILKLLKWKPAVSLEEGLQKTIAWQEEIKYDDAAWNWTK